MEKILQDIGLTPGEARVYLALLELNQSTVSPISKKAKVSISKIYTLLEGLIRKGLVSSIVKNNVKYFNAADPERIIDYLEEKKDKINYETEIIREKLPLLKGKQKTKEKKVLAEVYEGVNGIKTFFEKILRETSKGDIIYALGLSREVSEKYEGYFLYDWNKRRIKKKIDNKVIYNYDAREVGGKRAKTKFIEVRYLPKEIQTPSWIQMYGESIATIHMAGKNPVCIVINDKNIFKTYLAYFNFLWKVSKK